MKCVGIALWLCAGLSATAQAAEGKAARPANLSENYVGSPSEQLELATGPIVQQLREQYAGRLAGMFLERDQRQIVVRLTGPERVAAETHRVGGGDLQVVFEPNAEHTFAELNQVMANNDDKIAEALPTAHARYVDERTGEDVIAIAPDPSLEAKRKALTGALGVPVRIVVEEPVVLQPAMRK
ncbi:hypothetical protein NRY95_05430 [Xanthomonas campestris pv. phormiicola]|nr:hypothetical protein [Xanthomonas campestris pv. phormiicola]UYC17405.1 hypothetical protein NRY95_05430 [Xanthomonas campestris pv. phormiicola]